MPLLCSVCMPDVSSNVICLTQLRQIKYNMIRASSTHENIENVFIQFKKYDNDAKYHGSVLKHYGAVLFGVVPPQTLKLRTK